MANNKTLGVASYFIGLAMGDAAIHLLYSTTGPGTQKRVERAILMDGGECPGHQPPIEQSIYNTIKDIEDEYICQGESGGGTLPDTVDRRFLKFDAFVVTHWDHDHYEGVMFFLLSDLGAEVDKSDRLSRAFYDEKDKPLSTFYAPWWKTVYSSVAPAKTWSGSFKIGNDNKTDVGNRINMTIKIGNHWYKDMLRARIGEDKLIGRNLFARKDPDEIHTVLQASKDLSTLLGYHPSPAYGKNGDDIEGISPTTPEPMFLCLASNKWVIGGPTHVPKCKSNPKMTETNMSSICCILVWRETQKISLYTAGDVHGDLESQIAAWLQFKADGPEKIDGSDKITILKSSHHGSAHSTPYEFWRQMKPQYCMAMSGTNPRHGHPRWELLHDLHTWYTYAKGKGRFKDFYITNWPSYIGNRNTMKEDDADSVSVADAEKVLERCKKAWEDACLTSVTNPLQTYFLSMIWGAVKDDGKIVYKDKSMMWRIIMNSLEGTVLPDLADRDIEDLSKYPKRDYVSFDMPTQEENDLVIYTCIQETEIAEAERARNKKTVYKPKRRRKRARKFGLLLSTILPDIKEVQQDDSWDTVLNDEDSGSDNFSECKDVIPEPDKSHYVVGEGDRDMPEDPSSRSIVPRSNPLYFLIRLLSTRRLVLKSCPESSANGIQASLGDDDELQWWLAEALLAGSSREQPFTNMFFRASQWPPTESMRYDFDFQAAYTLSDGTVVTMACNTQTAPKALGVTREYIDAMTIDRNTIALGVAVTSTVPSLCLEQVTKLVGFTNSKLVTALGLLPLDPVSNDSGGRSALWFTPGTRYTTNLRLEFAVPDASKDEFTKWIRADALKLDIIHVGVVARRKTSFQDGNNDDGADIQDDKVDDAILSEGSIIFSVAVKLNGYAFTLYVSFQDTSVTIRLQRDENNQDESEFGQLLRWAASALGGKNTSGSEKFEGGTWESCQTWVDGAAELLGAIRPRAIQFALGYDEAGELQGVSGATLALQIELKTKVPDEKSKVVFFLTFGWNKARKLWMNGNLWCSDNRLGQEYKRALPGWEKFLNLEPTDPDHTIEHVDLKKLFDLNALPAGLPTEITTLSASLDGTGMSFEASITCTFDDKKTYDIPTIRIDNVYLRARRTWANKEKKTKATWQITFEIAVLLEVAEDAKPPTAYIKRMGGDISRPTLPCRLTGGIDYYSGTGQNDSSWTLTAAAAGLTVGHLAQFWPKGEVRNTAMSMLSHLVVDHLGLTYHYGSSDGDGGSDFTMDGTLLLGGIALDLDFYYDSGGWEFGATLSVKSKSIQDEAFFTTEAPTVGAILTELVGDDALPIIPGAVMDIPVGHPGKDGELLSFECVLIKDEPVDKNKKPSSIMVFTFSIQISAISLTMIQWRDTSWGANTPSKRVIKVALNEVGPIKAPLVGELKQPFEQLIYMWVSDNATATLKTPKTLAEKGAKTAGITKKEFDTLDLLLKNDTDKLYFKSDKLDTSKIGPAEFVIEAGSHLVVTAKNAKGAVGAVLDYVFGRPKTKANGKEVVIQDEKEYKDPAKAPFKKSAGPLSIENIGLTFDVKEKRLGVVLDATFLLGPLGLALLGFGISAQLESSQPKKGPPVQDRDGQVESTGFGSLPVSNLEITLSGLLVSFERPPVTIAGGFARTKMDGSTFYAGGLIVGFDPWKLQAMGVYGEVSKKLATESAIARRRHRRAKSSIYKIIELSDDDDVDDVDFEIEDDSPPEKKETYTMVFVILKLDGPLFSVGFADFSGLTAGVGLNSAIRLPTAEAVFEFPFTKPSGTPPMSDGPLASLKAVLWPPLGAVPWFTPREGSFWIAAGLKATAFTVLSVDAVVVVSMNPSIQLGIFGVAVADLPSIQSKFKFAHAELGIACVFDPAAGTFRLDAQLSPRSYVLHESCHLTGGMALYAWAQTGDFVLTLGGYHQAFVVPTAYPVPPRLGIAWSLSDNLRISGEAYFAMTARMCMGGGKLNATLNLGPLNAWFDAFLDFLINFRPFKFAADGGISVGVRFTLDLWLVTIRINAEIGARLSVLGPPMAGRVHVDFWVFGFDIDFGDRDAALTEGMANNLTLAKFKALVLKSAASAETGVPMIGDWADVQSQDDDDEKVPEDKTSESFLFNCSSGLLPDNNVPGGPSSEKPGAWIQEMLDNDETVPENAWPVSAGEFQFSITFAFAANYAKLTDNRPKRRLRELEVPIKDENKTIFALPKRQRLQLDSKIEVEITQEDAGATYFRAWNDDDKRREDRWLVKPIVKNVPKNFWGQYDPATDPALNGNSVASLLNAPTATGSIALVMGLTFQPPLPSMSKDLVPKFNIVRDMRQRVQDQGFEWKGEKCKASTRWNPRKEDEEDGLDQWTRVTGLWDTEETEKKAVDVVSLWAKKMCWDGSKGAALVGNRPRELLRRYENVIPAAPRIAVGV